MFNEIPKIRWRNVTVNGASTIALPTITLMTSTAELRVGMIVDHPSFPTGTKILSIDTANSITLDQDATSTIAASRDYFFEFVFRYPPRDDDGEELNIKERKSISVSGVRQISVDHIEVKRPTTFSFLTRSEIEELRFFWTDWAYLGKEFQFFDDKDGVTYIDYEMDSLDFKPGKVTPVLFKLPFNLRRVQ
jgi:hypothetical protein